MGCDIHAYIEFEGRTAPDGAIYWKPFASNFGDRSYVMFGIMAGVRIPQVMLFEPRGLPNGGNDLAYDAMGDEWMLITENGGSRCATPSVAKGWVSQGCSKYRNNFRGEPTWVSNPDHHSHSWMDADDLEKCIKAFPDAYEKCGFGRKEAADEWHAALAAMRAFEGLGKKCRLIFWFDN